MTYQHPWSPPRLVAPSGPVSAALRTMLAHAEQCDRQRLRDLRQAIADRIEADIALLDALSHEADEREADYSTYAPDGLTLVGLTADLEPDSDSDAEDGGDDEPSLGSINPNLRGDPLTCSGDGTSQVLWSAGGTDDLEAGDDNGIADEGGEAEQFGHVLFGSIEELCSLDGRPLIRKGDRLVSERWA